MPLTPKFIYGVCFKQFENNILHHKKHFDENYSLTSISNHHLKTEISNWNNKT